MREHIMPTPTSFVFEEAKVKTREDIQKESKPSGLSKMSLLATGTHHVLQPVTRDTTSPHCVALIDHSVLLAGQSIAELDKKRR